MKTLSQYLSAIDKHIIEKHIVGDNEIAAIFNDSRAVTQNSIFVAIQGTLSDGHDYIEEASLSGAIAIIHTKPIKEQSDTISYVRVSNSYSAYAILCEQYFDNPSKKFKTIGITGTNGKTTTAYIIRHILSDCNIKSGLISTVEYNLGSRSIPASRTTPEAFELQKYFKEITNSGCTHTIMEVSSHSLDQNRIGSTEFNCAVFTNLSGDHLDYHLDMESYFKAKLKLFVDHLSSDGTIIVNSDNEYGRRIIAKLNSSSMITYGKHKKSFCEIIEITENLTGTDVLLDISGNSFSFKTNLMGLHNVYNICAAISTLYALGIDLEKILYAINQQTILIPGRMEMVCLPNGAKVFVDYAHTDDALEHTLKTLKNLSKGKIFVVFGCGGDRDCTKRHRMGKIAEIYADHITVTDDNPRTENPDKIVEDIVAGINNKNIYKIIHGREEAIRTSINQLSGNDTLLIAGKGHETYQEINGIKSYFSDLECVRKILKS